MNKTKISVAMATYNGEKYIKEQIDSILKNLSPSDELVISDDGSTDNTMNIIKSYNDNRIKIIEGPRQGLKANFNNAIKNTNGDIIFLSDQDDLWYENKVNEIRKIFDTKDYILIQHDARVIDEKGNVIFDSFAKHRNVKNGIIKNLIKNSYHGCCIAFRKELKKYIIPIPNNIYLHDQWIGMIAELEGKTLFFNKKLMDYKRHTNNVSSFKHLSIFNMIKNRLMYFMALCLYLIRRI